MSADRLLGIGVVVVLTIMAALVFVPEGDDRSAVNSERPGQARDVDMDMLRRRLIRDELSDREALYYRKDR